MPTTVAPADPVPVLRGLSSMATRLVLAELVQAWREAGGCPVQIESIGGVDAAKRVAAGEVLDLVILAADAIDRLLADGHLLRGTRVDLVRSAVGVAVPAGAPAPDIGSAAALRAAVLAAGRIGISTGPSGQALAQLFERWGIADQVRQRLVVPPPGVPVGTLLARGDIDLGFQQLSELIHVEGIRLLGTLPPDSAIVTVFAGAVARTSQHPAAARAVLDFMASPAATAAKRRQGMEPA
ncbi:MAG: substrate-binding domain-containing protein [Pseudomonadota bacterium]